MKKLLLFVCVYLSALSLHAQTNLSVAESFIKALSADQYETAASYFDPSLKQVNKDILSSGWGQINAMFGNYKSYFVPQNTDANATSIVLGVHFEKETKGFACNFNSSHQLIGFVLAPVPQEGGQAAQAPSKFKEEEVAVNVNGGTLKGTIMLPDNKTQFTPIAIIIAGSGPVDRNGNSAMAESNIYKLLAEALAAKGIATLRYDKREVGASNDFKMKEADLRFDNYVQDAKKIISFLHDNKGYQNVYVIGHSEGSLIGMLAAETAKIDGYISIAGAGENIANTLERQLNNDPKTNNIIEQLKKGKQVTEVPDQLNAILRPSVQPYLISWMKYEPAKEIKKLKVPILLLQGTTDIQVQEKDAELLKAAAPAATLNIIKGMNHVLRDAPEERSANMDTYNKPSLPLNEELVSQIVGFMSAK